MRLGLFEFIEVKGGFIRKDAMLRFEFAREKWPMFSSGMMQLERRPIVYLVDYFNAAAGVYCLQ
jgi:hypothetical protein